MVVPVLGMGATDIWWVEARDDATHSIMHRRAPRTQNNLATNVNSASVKKLRV